MDTKVQVVKEGRCQGNDESHEYHTDKTRDKSTKTSACIATLTSFCTAHIHDFVPENTACQMMEYADRYRFH